VTSSGEDLEHKSRLAEVHRILTDPEWWMRVPGNLLYIAGICHER
jgi:hypothetical protein